MRLEAKKYLFDIQQAVALLVQFTAEKTFVEFVADRMLRSAVERQLEIIGEALAHLAKLDPAIAARINEYQRIISFRNILIHGYADVDERVVWDVVEMKLPALQVEVDTLLQEE